MDWQNRVLIATFSKSESSPTFASRFFLAGRVMAVKNLNPQGQIQIQDCSGKGWVSVPTACITRQGVSVGDIIAVHYQMRGGREVVDLAVLTPCRQPELLADDFFGPYLQGEKPQLLRRRQQVIGCIRQFFDQRGYLEVDTPILVASPGLEPHLDAFKTSYIDHQNQTHALFLPTSPEFNLKKLLAAGLEKIYQISKCFRNVGEYSRLHQPEFTMIEWYMSYANYLDLMQEVENLFHFLAKTLTFLDPSITSLMAGPVERLSVAQAFKQYAAIDLHNCQDVAKFRAQAKLVLASPISPDETWDDIFFKLFLERIEPHLGWERPLILYDYPAHMAALSTINPEDPTVCKRFEIFIKGIELGNAFEELTDVDSHRQRFDDFTQEKQTMGKEAYPVDLQFMDALAVGIPPSAGIAMGIDRLVAILLGQNHIAKSLAIPLNL